MYIILIYCFGTYIALGHNNWKGLICIITKVPFGSEVNHQESKATK